MKKERETFKSLSVGQLARRWRISVDRLRCLVEAGQIEAFQIPSAGRYGESTRILVRSIRRAERIWAILPAGQQPRRRHAARRPTRDVLRHFPELTVTVEPVAGCPAADRD